MIIEINEDIEKYEETVVMGLTAQQTLFSTLALLTGAGIILILYFYAGMGIMASCYISIPFIIPIALMGFYKYNGMNFFQFFSRFLKSFNMSKPLLYKSTESMRAYDKLLTMPETKPKKRTDEKNGKKIIKKCRLCKILLSIFIVLVVAVCLIGGYIYWQYGVVNGMSVQEIVNMGYDTISGIIYGF